MRHVVFAGLLSVVAGGGLAWLVSSASGAGSGLPLFHSGGAVIFNFVPQGTTSETKSATISNTGEGTLEITGVELPASSKSNFSIVTDGCTGTSLSAGQSCTVSVVFHPDAVGTLLGDLVITDARDECGNYVPLVGSGTEAQAENTARVADCIVPGATITVPGKTVTVPGKTVTVPGKTVTIKVPTKTPRSEVDALQMISPSRCLSGRDISERHFRLYLRSSKDEDIVLAWIYVNGRLASMAHGRSLVFVGVDLLGKPRHGYSVQVIANTATGRTLGLSHYFVACSADRLQRSSKRPMSLG
jgi:hypothetical protein